MIGKQVQYLQTLTQIQKYFFSRRTIINLKEYREKSATSSENTQSQQSNQERRQYTHQGSKYDSKPAFGEKKETINQNSQIENKSGGTQQQQQQYQETRSKQLSATIMKCSTDHELIKIFLKSPYPLESQHFAMIFYKFAENIQFQRSFDMQKMRLRKTQEDGGKPIPEKKYALSEKKMFIKVIERILLTLEEMNPDSLNLILKTLGKMKDDFRNKQLVLQLFNGIVDILDKDQNINFFSEVQLYYFIIYLNLLKKEVNDNKKAQKVITLALGKLAPYLANLKKAQLYALMNASVNLELYEQKYHKKLISAMLKRSNIMTPVDFTILFTYNSLNFQKQQLKMFNQQQEDLKNELANRIVHYAMKTNKLKDFNFKNLMKMCGNLYRINGKLEDSKTFNATVKSAIAHKFNEYMEINQNNAIRSNHPILLNDSLCYILTQPQIYRDHLKLFQSINIFVTHFTYFDIKCHIQICNFLVECLIRNQSGNEEYKLNDPQISTLIVTSLKQSLSRINENYSQIEYDDLEQMFELLCKIESQSEIKSLVYTEQASQLLTKSIKYISQIVHKFRTPVIIKIGQLMKKLLANKEKDTLIFIKYMKRYPFRPDFEKYEIAVQMKEAKDFFQSLQQPIDIADLMIEDKPEKSIDELDFTEDLEKVQEQIYQQATQRQDELMKIKQSKEEIQKQYAPLQVPSIQSLKTSEPEKYQHMMKYIEVFRKHSQCVNGILLSQIVFSDNNLKLKDLDIWQFSEKIIMKNMVPQLLTIDNINTILLSQSIYKLNKSEDLELLTKNDQVNQICQLRIETQQNHLLARKQPSIQKFIKSMQDKYQDKLVKIEEALVFENNLIDVAFTLNNGDKIAVITSTKAFEASDFGKPFNTRYEAIKYSTLLRKQILELNGFKQVIVQDNREPNSLFVE